MRGDPRFNSLHLESDRRQDYRRAREILLHSRGNQTLYSERHPDEAGDPSNTCIRNVSGKIPSQLIFWLADRDFIYPLKVGVNTLGRSADNDVIVEDLYVSRRHCAILIHHDQGSELHDTASKNGLLLNGKKIAGPATLRSGDEIRICNRQFVFLTRSGDAETGDPPAPSPSRTIAG
jgi:hypothetical protein